MVDEYRQRLTRNMDILAQGLEQIVQNYARHITLTEEDPETFGAGHYVLYPHRRTDRRFAIEERYIDTDWSDPDRLPASWTWKAQTRHQRSDGSYPWMTTDQGVVPSNSVHQLLGYAQKWAGPRCCARGSSPTPPHRTLAGTCAWKAPSCPELGWDLTRRHLDRTVHLVGMSHDNTRDPSRRAKKTKPSDQEPDVPPVLPHVVITVTEPTGPLAVTVDGEDFPAPEDRAWSRARFGELLDAVTEGRTRTVRIEVHETDGSTFTDIIRARRRTPPTPNPEAEQAESARSKPSGKLAAATVSGEGFLPGEDVAIAAVVTDTTANEDGEVETRLARRQKANLRAGAEVLVFGRSSGTTLVRRLP